MNIETITVHGDVSDYLHFGWKHTDDTRVRHGRHHYTEHILARDADMPNYVLIVALESKYFALKKQKKYYEPMDPLLSIALFVLLIIPFVIYLFVKMGQKDSIEAHNAEIQKQMDAILKEVAPLV